jgi:hypothetical protein
LFPIRQAFRRCEVSAGSYHSPGLRPDGTLVGWGDNTNGETSVPAGTFPAISAGGHHRLGIRARTRRPGRPFGQKIEAPPDYRSIGAEAEAAPFAGGDADEWVGGHIRLVNVIQAPGDELPVRVGQRPDRSPSRGAVRAKESQNDAKPRAKS